MEALVAVHLVAAAVALGWWLHHRVRRGFHVAGPPAWLRPGSLRLYAALERARHELFRGSPAVRLTLFMPDTADARQLRPVLRLGWGRAAARSTARFRLGEGLAGKAWDMGAPWLVARLPRGAGLDRRRELHAELFALGPEAAGRLSEQQLRAEVLLASVVADSVGGLRGVLSIDCLDGTLVPDAERPDLRALAWYRRLQRVSVDVGLILEAIGGPASFVGSATRTVGQSRDRSASIAALRFTPASSSR
jgi:hypothetical protein